MQVQEAWIGLGLKAGFIPGQNERPHEETAKYKVRPTLVLQRVEHWTSTGDLYIQVMSLFRAVQFNASI